MTEGGGILHLNGRSFRLRGSGYGSICIIQGNDSAKVMYKPSRNGVRPKQTDAYLPVFARVFALAFAWVSGVFMDDRWSRLPRPLLTSVLHNQERL